MKFITSTLAILAVVFASANATAWEVEAGSFGKTFVDRNCSWCHGPSLQGFTTAPRLAGQRPPYLENQLLSFQTHARNNPLSQQYMWGAAATLNPEIARELAGYLSRLEAEPADDGDSRLAPTGKQSICKEFKVPIFRLALRVTAHVVRALRQFLELEGCPDYLKRKLEEWGEGYHAAALAPMPDVASKLSANDIEALASYLSFVR